jgi:peptidoglycan/LPS O-acetylase OafA/YrhL
MLIASEARASSATHQGATAAHGKARSAGLDTLRALAITLVFVYHYAVFVSGEPTFGVLSDVGWTGVDLFFVLSGYLISNQLIGGMARGGRLQIGRFYLRRWMRTFPAFWVVLACYALYPEQLAGAHLPAVWRFLTFTQNLGLKPGTAFSHAWSLCIEEQFYLILPIVLVVGAVLRFSVRAAWIGLALLWSIGIVSRIVFWNKFGTEASGHINMYYTLVYYGTLCRFDEFLPGVALAIVKNAHPELWRRLIARGTGNSIVALLAVVVMLFLVEQYYYIDDYGYGFFMSAFGYSLVAVAYGAAVLAALSPASLLYRIRIPGVERLALWSYSFYLSHKAVAHVIGAIASQKGWGEATTIIGILALSLMVAAALYAAVERPFMSLRDRLIPTNFQPQAASASAARTALESPI